jgi:hypothetical protein
MLTTIWLDSGRFPSSQINKKGVKKNETRKIQEKTDIKQKNNC